MKLLQLCPRVPFPAIDGGTIAMQSIARALTDAGNEVTILSLNTKKHHVDPRVFSMEYLSRFNPRSVDIDTGVKAIPAFISLLDGSSYNITRFHSKQFEELLAGELVANKFDTIILESIFMTSYIPENALQDN